MFPFRRRRATLAVRGERKAVWYLRLRGFRILDRNVRLAGCEIDIIAREGDTIAFVEVKTRRDDSVTQPEDSIGYTKRKHIRRAAQAYIAAHPDPECYYRFDTVSIVMPDRGKSEVVLCRNAFGDE